MSTNDYQRQIHQLMELQKVDDQIFAVKRRMENAPRDLDELEQKFNIVEGKRGHIQDKVSHLQDQKKRISQEIDEDAEKIKKSKNKLMQVGNTREYQAMLRELDSMEKVNRTREEERLTLLEELKIQTAALEEIDKEHVAVKKELDALRDTLDPTLREAAEELKSLGKKREEASKSVPLPIFMRYEFIRERLEHPVIVEVDEGICSGCHIAIPPQTFIDLQMGQQILSCPNCQRLIFWSQHFESPLETASRRAGSGVRLARRAAHEETGELLEDEENLAGLDDEDQIVDEDDELADVELDDLTDKDDLPMVEEDTLPAVEEDDLPAVEDDDLPAVERRESDFDE